MLSSPRYLVLLLSLGMVAGACVSESNPEDIGEEGEGIASGKADSAFDGIVGSWEYLPPPTARLVGPSYMTFMNDMTYRSERSVLRMGGVQQDVERGDIYAYTRRGTTYLRLTPADGGDVIRFEWRMAGEVLEMKARDSEYWARYARSESGRCDAPADCEAQGLYSVLTCVGDWACNDMECKFECGGGDTETSCGGWSGDTCSDSEFCDFAPEPEGGEIVSWCDYADAGGVCRPRPEACLEIYDPVCGCNGETYGNECEAQASGTDVHKKGECPGAEPEPERCGGLAGFTCSNEADYCNYGSHCGFADQMGECQPRPDVCPAVARPVCGCDGRTYSNSCRAASAGISVRHNGPCAG